MNNKKKKLLLIDDNDDTLDLLEIFFYKEYDIITAQNGFEALNKAQEEMPDCILTDIMMPVMDGIRFFNELKKNEQIAQIPVIAITSFIKKANTKSLMNIGFSEVISKPLQFQKILATINKTIKLVTHNEK